ncbi:MAG: hypothetical protein BJG00_000660 [Limnothrix sp. CACIAM 69d]|nr:MAG: hypothetical protein BJG00_000660 [Limnothrix sp. CACIAM 69d]
MAEIPKVHKRYRGVMLSPQGWQRLQSAEQISATQQNQGKPYTLEQLSYLTQLSPNTLTKVRRREKLVDFQSLLLYFQAFGLDLSEGDYLTSMQVRNLERTRKSTDWAMQVAPPRGQLPIDSPFYIHRPPLENLCIEEVVQPGSLVRIKAPRQYGKTSLIARTLSEVQQRGFRTAVVNLQGADRQVLGDLDWFLKWFCASAAKSLGLTDRLADQWDPMFGVSYACSEYFENYLLTESDAPLLLVLDELDRLFGYPELATDFFGLLRSWYEQGRYGLENRTIWHKLHIAIIHSTEVWLPLSLNQSPFNVGLLLELPAFTCEQVVTLAQQYQLTAAKEYGHAIFTFLGGNPFLSQIGLFYLAHQKLSLADLPQQATNPDSVFSSYLRRLLKLLEQQELLETMQQVVRSPKGLELPHTKAFRLQGLGLVTFDQRLAFPSCELFRQFFLTLP